MVYKAPKPLSSAELEARYWHCVAAATRDVTPDAEAAVESLILSLSESRPCARRVVFFAKTPYFVILREALCLRRAGVETVLACISPLPADLRPIFEEAFDHICDGLGGFVLFGEICRRVEADIFHLQLWMYTYHYARFVIEAAPGKNLVCEFYDVTSTGLPRDELCEKQSAIPMHGSIIDLDLEMERYVFRNAGGVVHRMPPGLAHKIRDDYSGSAELFTLQAWPLERLVRTARNAGNPNPDALRFVYAGALHPSDIRPDFSTIAKLPSVFESLLRQGHRVDILNDPYRMPSRKDPSFALWFELEDRFEHFHLRPGVPPHQLPDVLSAYDFGLNVLTDDRGAIRNHRTRIENIPGTKLFAYLEAGLPVLTNREVVFLSAFVTEHGVGIAPDWDELDDISGYLRKVDIPGLYRNVDRFNQENLMEKKLKDLVAFYDAVIAAAD